MKLPAYLIVLVFLLQSCDRPYCTNTDPALAENPPNSKAYNAALAARITIAGTENLNYWVDSVAAVYGRRFLIAEVQGDSLCAELWLDASHISNDDRISRLVAIGGRSYAGAGLSGLKFRLTEDSTGVKFKYLSVDRIID